MRIKFIFLCIIAMIFSSWLYADIVNITARNYGLEYGNTSSAIGADGVFVNSASLPYNDFHEFYAGYSRLFMGLDNDDLSQSYFLYSTPNFWNFAFGAGFIQFSADKYSESEISLATSYKIPFSSSISMALGVTPHLNMVKYKNYGDDPLFVREGDSNVSFGLDTGLRFVWQNLSFGANYENLIKPTLALDDSVEAGELPYSITSTVSYNFAKIHLQPFFSLYVAEDDVEKDIRFSGGAEYRLFDDLVSVRVALSEKDINFGIGIRPNIVKPTSFDYTFANRKLDNVNFINHHVGMGIQIPYTPSIRNKPNIFLALDSNNNLKKVNSHLDSVIIPIQILHDEESIKDDFNLLVRVIGSSVIEDTFLVKFDTDTIAFNYSILPSEVGNYKIQFIVDFDNEISESDESDNQIFVEFVSVGDLIATVETQHNELEIRKLTYISEEEPFIPIIFFDESSAEIPSRFHNTLDILSDRLKDNPDVFMQLHGYVDTETDSFLSLATERSQNVRQYLLNRGVPRQQIDMISVDTYDIVKPRLTGSSVRVTEQELSWISQENRRVELSPVIGGKRELDARWAIGAHTDGVSGFIQQYRELICNNPDVTVQLEWFMDKEFTKSYKEIDALRDFIRIMIDHECGTETVVPIILTEGDKGEIGLSLSAEKIIYSPVQHALSAKDFQIPSNMRNNKISIDINSPEAVVNHILFVEDTKTGEVVRKFSTGNGAPARSIVWDWRNNDGNLLDPNNNYVIKLGLKDIVGNTYTFSSDTISIVPTESMHRLSSSIIIQFMFDEISSTSRFLESRVDNFAHQIVDIAENKKLSGATVRVIGHTDPIGAEKRNTELSQQRSQKEYNSLTNHLIAILGLNNATELEAWLSERNINLIHEGLAASAPYIIERYRDNKFETIKLGDNNYPEGRSINRRVIIEIDENLKGEKK